MPISPSIADIGEVFSAYDLKILGVTDADSLSQDRAHLEKWQSNGYAAGMQYMQKPADQLASPVALWPEVKSIISVGLFYGAESLPPIEKGFGRVARYAWRKDYHHVFRENLKSVSTALEKFGGARIFSDSIPLLERAIAAKTGQAFIGKNSLCIVPREGSFFLLGEIFLSFSIKDVVKTPQSSTETKRCGTCVRCIADCPTGALIEPRVLDANRCISYLTIEHRGPFTAQQSQMIGDWIFGCDICQEVCPYNAPMLKLKKRSSRLLDLTSENGSPIKNDRLNLLEVLSINSNREFEKRFKDSPILRARRSGLIRNAQAVAANQGMDLTQYGTNQ